jgi:hypothetical protein
MADEIDELDSEFAVDNTNDGLDSELSGETSDWDDRKKGKGANGAKREVGLSTKILREHKPVGYAAHHSSRETGNAGRK